MWMAIKLESLRARTGSESETKGRNTGSVEKYETENAAWDQANGRRLGVIWQEARAMCAEAL
jgi:hypothetical protein